MGPMADQKTLYQQIKLVEQPRLRQKLIIPKQQVHPLPAPHPMMTRLQARNKILQPAVMDKTLD